jgi:hypothetical protein
VDSVAGPIDHRQLEFFASREVNPEYPPRKLILITSTPTTAFGRRASKRDRAAVPFAQLKLPRPFLDDGERIADDACRLDLAGDVHHYARYFGGTEGAEPSSYASVVSGLGGAFLHPTHTDFGQVSPEALYPPKEQSRSEVARRIINPINIFKGGLVGVFGFLVAFTLVIAATFRPERYGGIDSLLSFVTSTTPDLTRPPADDPAMTAACAELAGRSPTSGAAAWLHRACECDPAERSGRLPALGRGLCQMWPAFVFLLGALGAGLLVRRAIHAASVMARRVDRQKLRFYLPSQILIVAACLVLFLGYWLATRHCRGLAGDVLVSLFVIALALCTISILPRAAAADHGTAGKLGFRVLGVWHFLLQALSPLFLLRTAGVVTTSLSFVLLALLGAGAYAFAARLSGSAPPGGKGLSRRAVVARAVVLSLLWLAAGAAMFSLPCLLGQGYQLPSPSEPWLRRLAEGAAPAGGVGSFAHGEVARWLSDVFLAVLGGLFGYALSLVWFAWYLLVSDAWNGHSNEVGGAARIERFKQLIRFKLTETSLTGYVIAVDDPKTDGAELTPRIVDVLTIRPRR